MGGQKQICFLSPVKLQFVHGRQNFRITEDTHIKLSLRSSGRGSCYLMLWEEMAGAAECRQSGKLSLKEWSVQFSCSVVSDSLWPHGLQHARLPCASPSHSNSCPLSRWSHPAISPSVVLFSSHLQSFPSSGSFPMSQFFASDGQSIWASALGSVLPMNIQDWFPLGLTGLISLQSEGFSRVFSSTMIRKASVLRLSAFFMVQLSYLYMTSGNTTLGQLSMQCV